MDGLKRDFDAYTQLVCQPGFVCKDCGRVASKKNHLCNLEKIGWIEVDERRGSAALVEEEVIPIGQLLATD